MPGEEEGEEKSGLSSSGKRQRFYIELKPEETTIVSWKKLLKDAKEIDDQCPANITVTDQRKIMDNFSNVSQQSKSCFLDERREPRTRVRSSNDEQLMDVLVPKVESPKVEDQRNDGLTGKTEDYGNEFRKATANTQPMLQNFLSRLDSSALGRDDQLEKLHDVPVLMYSKKSSAFSGKLNRPTSLNVRGGASVFPLKTKHATLHKSQRLPSEKSRVNMKAANDPSTVMCQNSARRSAPLQTYRRSKSLLDGRKNKFAEMWPADQQLKTEKGIITANSRSIASKKQVQSMVHNDNVVGLVMGTGAHPDAAPAPRLKRKFTDSVDSHMHNASPSSEGVQKKIAAKRASLIDQRSQHAKAVKFKLSAEGTSGNICQQPHAMEPKMEVPERGHVKIRFHLKPQHEICKPELNHSRAASPVTCKQPS